MENPAQQEHDLPKHDDSVVEETPPMQSTEPVTDSSGKPEADPVKKLQDELAEAKDKYLRLYAEFDNFRRRTAKERLELIQTANEKLLRDFLPVADDFERAEKSFAGLTDKEAEGFKLIHNKFKKLLDQNGVKPMEAGPAVAFNPDLHEAITQIPAPEEKLKGKILDVVEKGYLLHDKVVRFAKVVVGQ